MRPFVPDTLLARKKGERIPYVELKVLVGLSKDHTKYTLKICAIALEMERLRRLAGNPCTVIQDKNDLRVLTDAEASKYNRGRSDVAVRLLRRSHQKAMEVSASNLDEKARQAHDRDLVVTGARVVVTTGHLVNRLANLVPAMRSTPSAASYAAHKKTP